MIGKHGQSISEAQLITQNKFLVPNIHLYFRFGDILFPFPFFFINIIFSWSHRLGGRTGKCSVKRFPPHPLLFSSLLSQV